MNIRLAFVVAFFLATLTIIHSGWVLNDHEYDAGLIPSIHSAAKFPAMSYSVQRIAPLEIAKVFGRSKGCATAGPETIALISRTSLHAGLDPKLAASVVDEESGCDSLAVSNRGAIGLFQVTPRIWKSQYDFSAINLFNPEQNATVGTQILADLVRQYGETEALRRYQGLGQPANPNYVSQVESKK